MTFSVAVLPRSSPRTGPPFSPGLTECYPTNKKMRRNRKNWIYYVRGWTRWKKSSSSSWKNWDVWSLGSRKTSPHADGPQKGEMTSSTFPQSSPLGANLELGLLGLSGGTEMELQKMLIDERTKCELHRRNYETLKAEHSSLQEELMQVQGEVEYLQAQQEKLQLQLVERTGEVLEQNRELEELRLQVMTPQRLELLRAQVQQELEDPVRERFSKLEEEAEKYRTEFNKLRYGYTLLNAQFQHQKEESTRVLEEQKLRYEAEISHLEKDKENLVAQYQNLEPLQERKEVEVLLREKSQLTLRVKGLQAEVVEVQALHRNSEQQAENVQRLQKRQLSECQAALNSLEAERQSLRLRLERMESELGVANEQHNQLTRQCHKAEKQVTCLTNQTESLRHSHKMEVASVKLECTRSKGEVERARDTLKGQLDGLQTDVEVLKAALERHKEIVVEKERELVRKVQSAREEEIYKTTVLHEEKLELEHRLAELEQQVALQDTKEQAQKEEWEEHLCIAQKGEESVRKELQTLKSRFKLQSCQLQELERQTSLMTDLKQKQQELCGELGTLSRSEAELMEANQHLRAKLDNMREELRNVRAQAERSQHEAERRVEESHMEWLEDKHKLQERQAKLEEKYSQLKEKLHKAAVAQKKRRSQREKKEKSLQNTIQLLEAQMEQIKLEAAAANKRPLQWEEHAQMRRRLRELQRRHDEFRRLLLGDHSSFTFGPALLTSTQKPFVVRDIPVDIVEEEEMLLLRQRMDQLDVAQQQQLQELGGLVHQDPQVDL
ncbi:centrosomal protein of 83 kDa-like isoform X3 [Entelurus aequoreus]|uniref:centrosomal protein of 83 kDa-like isoform X3 n=1 Tax=Entelurus aequoreus TaxID=161455 RepID=UPI002B1DE9AD|nr:centrosomal protein of 83 kDa-like isoform X3 [Entelurus aequoreus]